jgi:hypothetical protein
MFQKSKPVIDPELIAAIKQMPCCCCGARQNVDPSHIRSVGSGGGDLPHNVKPLCRSCHIQWHQYGAVEMISRNPQLKQYIENLGWKIVDFGNRRYLKHETEI